MKKLNLVVLEAYLKSWGSSFGRIMLFLQIWHITYMVSDLPFGFFSQNGWAAHWPILRQPSAGLVFSKLLLLIYLFVCYHTVGTPIKHENLTVQGSIHTFI